VDKKALQQGLEALAQEKIVAITPEGTRSGTGRLQRGHPGIVTLALHSGAPLLPLVYYGGETIHSNLRRLRRTDFHIKVGQLFMLDPLGQRITREIRQHITDEIMCQLAALLPPAYRGAYTDLNSEPPRYLRFL
jgi:1-acyl-sn-glycerol-3-phosphate acyltransferase